jgi:hypothetical protein
VSNDTKKGLSPLAWVAIGCGALVLIVFIGVVAVGGFAYFKVKEHVQVDKDGNVTVKTPDGDLQFDTSGEGGSVKVKGKDGSEVTWGANTSLEDVPEWVQDLLYANATATQGTWQTSTAEGVSGIVSMTTDDDPKQVIAFFKQELEDAGYAISGESTTSTPQGKFATIIGEDADEGRTVNVGVVQSEEQTQVTLNYNDKN